ncbi:hypothetical protein ACVGXN_02980, partial [Enterobacter hormaechei]
VKPCPVGRRVTGRQKNLCPLIAPPNGQNIAPKPTNHTNNPPLYSNNNKRDNIIIPVHFEPKNATGPHARYIKTL